MKSIKELAEELKIEEVTGINWDLDGTLANTRPWKFAGINYINKIFNLKKTGEEINQVMGLDIRPAYKALTGQEDVEHFFEPHRQFMIANVHLVQLFAGAKEILTACQSLRIPQALVTNRSRRTGLPVIKQWELSQYFTTMIFFDDTKELKPSPEPIRLALRRLKIKPSKKVLLFDDTTDGISPGNLLGLTTIGCTFGLSGNEVLKAEPDYYMTSLSEFRKILP